MNALAIEILAAGVAKAYNLKLPVDLELVCMREEIEMAPGHYSPKFHGRLEFHPQEGSFILFYPLPNPQLPLGRVRFSICHELGHFYIDEHRDLIVSGRVHNSVEPFHFVKHRIESEADLFASALLIPESAFLAFAGSRKFLTLEAIFQLSRLAQASMQATAFRYVMMTDEACAVVFSKGNKIIRSRSSRWADDLGFGGFGSKTVPDGSAALKCLNEESKHIVERASHTVEWFSPRNHGARLWEESARLGETDYAVTLLSWPDLKND